MDDTQKRARKRRFLPKLLLVILGLAVGALIGEVALRGVGYSFPEFYQLDQNRGYALRPGMAGWYRKEGAAFITINSEGLRDRERSIAKPADTFRIAILGDSYPEALQVPLENAFWMVMENRLQECGVFGQKKVEVINLGVSGYGTAQQLITLREHVWKYSPDIVLLTITTNNDVTDNSRTLKKTDQIPYFIHRDGKLVLDDSFKSNRGFLFKQTFIARVGRWFRDSSRLIQAISQGQRAWRLRRAASNTGLNLLPVAHAGESERDLVAASQELGVDNLVYREMDDPVWRDAWSVTESLIRLMREEVEAKGARFLVVTLSNGPQVHPDINVRKDFMQRFLVQDIFYPDQRLKEFSDRHGVQLLMLAPELQAYADQHQEFLHGFNGNPGSGHWNITGHRVAGALLGEKLCAGSVLK